MKTKLTTEQKEANKLARNEAKKLAAKIARIESEKNQKPVQEITITIEWKKSRMWGMNPHCTASVFFRDHSSERSDVFTASGCGYDKESTVIAEVFNKYLKYKLHAAANTFNHHSPEKPYGIYLQPDFKRYDGGIGANCYYRISEFIGGKFEHIAGGNTFDVYKYTDNLS